MRRPSKAWVVAAAGSLASASGVVAVPATTHAAETPPAAIEDPVRPKDPFTQLPIEEQIRILTPLRAIGRAVGKAAPLAAPGTYSGLRLEAMDRVVDVYVTDSKSAEPLLAEAKRIDPEIDLTLVRVHTAPYSQASLVVAMTRLGERRPELPYKITSVGVLPDGTGLAVGVENPALVPNQSARIAGSTEAPLDPSSIAGVPTFIEQRAPVDFASRMADEMPYRGGSLIQIADSQGYKQGECTSGLPALDAYDFPRMVTAAHCGRNGDLIFTGGNVKQGNIYDYNEYFDGSVYAVPSVQGQIWYGEDRYNSGTKPFSRMEHADPGDWICNGGVVSAMVCDIQVITAKTTWYGETRWGIQESHGPYARQANGEDAVRPGDSGGPVFAFVGDGTLTAHGVVSAGAGVELYFGDALALFTAFNLRPAP